MAFDLRMADLTLQGEAGGLEINSVLSARSGPSGQLLCEFGARRGAAVQSRLFSHRQLREHPAKLQPLERTVGLSLESEALSRASSSATARSRISSRISRSPR